MDVGYLTALVAGALALLSPCGALLLPSFFAVTFTAAHRLALHALVFLAGLITLLAPLGAGAAFAGSLLTAHRSTLILVSGWLIIVLGIVQIFGGGFDARRLLPKRLQQAHPTTPGRSSLVSAFLLGLVSAVAGFCTGPILGAVLTMAGASGSPFYGMALLSIYGLGMALPLFVIAAVWGRFGQKGRKALRGRAFSIGRLRLHTTSVITGALLIAVGILFVSTNGLVGVDGIVSTSTAFDIQVTANNWANKIPDVALIIVAALIALAVWAWWAFRRPTPAKVEKPNDARIDETDAGVR